jgi:hypothetical protein
MKMKMNRKVLALAAMLSIGCTPDDDSSSSSPVNDFGGYVMSGEYFSMEEMDGDCVVLGIKFSGYNYDTVGALYYAECADVDSGTDAMAVFKADGEYHMESWNKVSTDGYPLYEVTFDNFVDGSSLTDMWEALPDDVYYSMFGDDYYIKDDYGIFEELKGLPFVDMSGDQF